MSVETLVDCGYIDRSTHLVGVIPELVESGSGPT
jgi:hypothetical protein